MTPYVLYVFDVFYVFYVFFMYVQTADGGVRTLAALTRWAWRHPDTKRAKGVISMPITAKAI